MKNIKLVILDFDGTLVSSMGHMDDMIRKLLLQYDVVADDDMLARIKPKGFVAGSEFIKKEYNLDASADEIFDYMRQELALIYKEEIQLKPGVIEFVKALRDKKLKLCVATANQRDFVLAAIERTGLDEYLDYTVTINELNTTKQSPKLFLHCAKKFDLLPQQCMVFEDSAHACKVAKDAGFLVAGVRDESNEGEEEVQIKAISDIFIEDFDQALKIFSRIL